MNKLFKIEKSFYRKVFIIAVPIIIQNFITSLLNIVDTMMIGRLGEREIAAVGIANQYFFLFNIVIMGCFSGIGIFVSQYWGKKDVKNIKRLVGIGSIIAIIIGVIFTFIAQVFPSKIMSIFNTDSEVIRLGAEYLVIVSISYIFTALSFNYGMASRCIEKTKVPMLASCIALAFNTVFNLIFIFGEFGLPAMGVKGAALATLLARILEFIIITGYIYYTKSPLAGRMKELLDFNWNYIKNIFMTIIPVVLNEACWGLGSVMYNVIYGRIGTEAIAAVQISTTVINLFMVAVFGISSACLVIVGKEVGKGDNEQSYSYAKYCIILGCGISLVLSLILILSSNLIVGIYDVSPLVKSWSKAIIFVTSLIMIIRVYNIILIVGVLRGGGDTKVSLVIEASTMWLIGVPLAFIGAFIIGLPVYLVYALSTVEEVVKCIICYRRFKTRKWINNLVDNK